MPRTDIRFQLRREFIECSRPSDFEQNELKAAGDKKVEVIKASVEEDRETMDNEIFTVQSGTEETDFDPSNRETDVER